LANYGSSCSSGTRDDNEVAGLDLPYIDDSEVGSQAGYSWEKLAICSFSGFSQSLIKEQ
jgi:hypothetical protein